MRVFDTDNRHDVEELRKISFGDCLERSSDLVYGSSMAVDAGLVPIEDSDGLDILLDESELEEALDWAHMRHATPGEWDYKWCPKGDRYNQNGLGYCWTWSAVGALRTLRCLEGKDDVSLAPVSMGYLVGWANRGNYLSSIVGGLQDRGVCPGDKNDHRNSARVWEPLEDQRRLYRLDEVWDLNPRDMVRQCTSCLVYGRPILGAWSWWGHAVQLVDCRFVNGRWEAELNNSHNEPEHIFLTGSKAPPSEAICFVSSVHAE